VKSQRVFIVLTLLALAAILYFRLTPFDFTWTGHVPWERITLVPLSLRDVPLNVLLFVPLGFGLAGLLARRRGQRLETGDWETERLRVGDPRQSPVSRLQSPLHVGGQVLVICLALSTALEAIQLFLPEHVPSLADVLANGVGAMIGYGLYRAWEMGFGAAVQRYATGRNLLVGLSLYLLGVALLTGYLYRSVRLSNWDTSFPLVVGNEAVGRREWSGNVGYATFTIHEDSSPMFVAAYAFGGVAPFEDATGGGAPLLDWAAGPTTPQSGDSVTLGPGEWLVTAGPFAGFNEVARRTDHFAIEAAVTSADPAQRGPARIISISADAEHRNVTIGQEGGALIIRLRTPAAGENGQKPELLVPGVFADERPRLITVGYDAPMLRVTVDNEEYALSLAPGAAFFPGFATENRWPVVMGGNPRRYDYAYAAIVTGLPALLFGGLWVARWLAERDTTDYADSTD